MPTESAAFAEHHDRLFRYFCRAVGQIDLLALRRLTQPDEMFSSAGAPHPRRSHVLLIAAVAAALLVALAGGYQWGERSGGSNSSAVSSPPPPATHVVKIETDWKEIREGGAR